MAQETIEKRFNVPTPAVLKVNNISGSVDIGTGDEGVIHIRAVKNTHPEGGETTQVEISQEENGAVSVVTKYKDQYLGWVIGSEKVCDVDYVIKAPRKCSFVIHGVSDDVHMVGFEGELKLKNVSGDISLQDITGSLSLDTVSGDISTVMITGEGQIKSVSGDIDLQGAQLSSIHVTTVSGDVSLHTAILKGPYQFNTVSGDVQLLVPGDTHCNTELHSLSGEFFTNLPVSESRGGIGSNSAKLQGGGVEVSLKSISGDLSVETISDIPQKLVVTPGEIISKVERGEISVDEAVLQLKK